MIVADLAPPRHPSADEQRSALRKGLGRAVSWARCGRLEDEHLLEACLRDLRHDVQLEETRGAWLWQMIDARGAVDRFRTPILRAFHDLADPRSASQLCELAYQYAARGDDAFRMRLYEVVDRKPVADEPCLAEHEIIQLDGEEAFLFAARVRGRRLAAHPWDWDAESLVADAVDRLGEARVEDVLGREKDGAIRSFREEWSRQRQAKAGQAPDEGSWRERMQAIPAGEIVSAAESDAAGFNLFRGWGIHAGDSALDVVLQQALASREPAIAARLLQVFSKRALPRFDRRLIDLCGHPDLQVRARVLAAFGQTRHPAIRAFALAELERGASDGAVVALFARNFQRGDETRILDAIQLPGNDEALHSLLMGIIRVLEANPDADCARLALICYAETPCGPCRYHAARLLRDRGAAPRWLGDECRDDAEERCRRLAADAPSSGTRADAPEDA